MLSSTKNKGGLLWEPNLVCVNVFGCCFGLRHDVESCCIIQMGWKIMHHLCSFPCGPVRIDPQPLTFSECFPADLSCQCVALQACECFVYLLCFSLDSACIFITFSLGNKVQVRHTQRDVFFCFKMWHKSKVNVFLFCFFY